MAELVQNPQFFQVLMFLTLFTDVLYDLDLGGPKVHIGGRDSPASITSSTFYDKNTDANTLLPIIQGRVNDFEFFETLLKVIDKLGLIFPLNAKVCL